MKPPGLLARGLVKRAALAGGLLAAGLVIAPPAKGGYRGLRQARFAPPGWVYGPAWTAIELALADSTVRCRESERPGRNAALAAPAANDALYLLFPLVYFPLRSPVLTAAVTVAQLMTLVAFLTDSSRLRPMAWATAAIGLYAIWDYERAASRARTH